MDHEDGDGDGAGLDVGVDGDSGGGMEEPSGGDSGGVSPHPIFSGGSLLSPVSWFPCFSAASFRKPSGDYFYSHF